MSNRPRIRPSVVVSVIVLTVGAFGMLAPFLFMIVTALKSAQHAYDLPPNWIPREFRWENFAAAVNGPLPLLRNMFNSFFIATLTTLGMLITAPMAGYAFAHLRFPGRNSLFVLLLASLMVPVQVTVIPLFLIMRNLHLIDTPWSLILPGITGALGVFMMRQFFLVIPKELFEAATVDGANAWTTYRLVALPLVRNGLSALGIVTFLASWNAYFAPSVFLNSQDSATLPLALVLMRGPFSTGQLNVMMAATTLAVIPALIAYLFAQRWIIAGLTSSAVKG
ncbi:ABC transporter permease [Acrocarpospora pleiomorpha]|uniref:ABC transporter permease n=1 Tax=Acrocarpospora pleiomorpha TaxID=90975 RepID=A0A5M3XJ02_9ACTN|nr:carbohydrate ABC transporter permease [Acrocarpospora pleiomorpha]GES20742.1 ABC transporter permease [Acrocarpospora pleiomorpha]